jgi:hypothetical protein
MYYYFVFGALILTSILVIAAKMLENYAKNSPPPKFAMKIRRKLHWMTPKRYVMWKIRNLKTKIKKWKLRNKKDEIINKVFSEIDKKLRPVCISQVGGFKPSKDLAASWFGNVLLSAPGESWPNSPKRPMSPLIQINLKEVQYVPEKLKDYEMITVFIDPEDIPINMNERKGIEIRLYKRIDELVPLVDRPNLDFCIRPFPLKWQQTTQEGPDYSIAMGMTDMTDFGLFFDDLFNVFSERYHCTDKTKIGGYPALIQDHLEFGNENYLFQIGSEEKASWMWGDCGIGYFGMDDNGRLLFEWQCY